MISGCENLQKISDPSLKPAIKQKEVKATPQPVAAAEAPVVTPPVSNYDVIALKEGLSLYNDGDYNGAIKKLSGTEIWSGHNKAIQLSALKTMAFSYCVTSRAQLCRQQFERALKLDPNFDLLPSEIGHPIWGPVFLKAKKAK
ncbi:TssQ family T6SS-associated lipoprotein [Undibacterium sp. RuTC16W]|uniref:TssQ family T6SS-associated lipoprotein n=1 Tax=Undibacterium sp. RuTC16W TaxID=3413048 RepID=UPI003BF22F07